MSPWYQARTHAWLDSFLMEDPCDLLGRVLAFADAREQIVAVTQTGSRARSYGGDAFSDLDIELIGPGTAELVGNDEWPGTIADVLVSLHLANQGPDDPDWPTCLVVFAGGRKVDFTLAGTARIEAMKHEGLDTLYQRGYLVHRDKTGITNGLAAATMAPPDKPAPTAGESRRISANSGSRPPRCRSISPAGTCGRRRVASPTCARSC